MTEYDPLFWDIETTGFDPMEPPAWEDGVPNVMLCVAFGHFEEGWRDAIELDEVGVNVEIAAVSGVSGKDNRWDIFGAEHYLIDDVFGEDGMMMKMDDRIQDMGRDTFLTGWNTRNFDHSYAAARCARHRLDGEPVVSDRKRLDMMRPAATDYGNSHAVSEDNYLEYVGIESDDEFDGSDMFDEFEAGRIESIESHAYHDVVEMMDLFFLKRELMYGHFYEHYDELGEPPMFGDVITF